ncbi:MAG: hypothetical protein IKD76_06890 [Clostridia bacterium]|nr:hypothetical protein [Clostridia bacterium]
MWGKVLSYDEMHELGYIEGYDEIRYFFHQINVKNREKLNVGDIVNFDYLFEQNKNQLPYAVNIQKEYLSQKSKPYRELYEILKYLPDVYKKKIPLKFLVEIEEQMDTLYEYSIEHFEDFENQKMLDETKVLLAIVYRDYLASEKEKKEIFAREEEEQRNIEKVKREMNNPDNIFKKKEVVVSEGMEKNALVATDNVKWYKKVIEFFRGIFKRKGM